jgi:hypothetical protein
MTPEQKLLILCAAPYPNDRQIEEIRRLADAAATAVLDWQEIITQSNKHGISQMVFHTIEKTAGVALSETVHSELQRQFDWAVRQNLFLTAELIRIIHLLEKEGITAVPFKGPVLADKLYGSLALRVFIDLDILIHPEDREKVRETLLNDGFQPRYHPDSAFQFVKPNSLVILEVHWEAISFGSDWLRKLKSKPLPTTLSHLTPRLESTTLVGKKVSTLSPEDTLLIMTIHGSKHWWSRLNWLSDIAALVHVYPSLDWDWILEQVNYWKIRRLVFLGLNLAHQHLEVALPESVLDQIKQEPHIDKLSDLVESMFFIEQNFFTRYIKRPTYFRHLWDMADERRTLYLDHLALYLELFINFFRKQPASRK